MGHIFRPKRSEFATFQASVSGKTRTELMQMKATLAKGNAHPGMLRMVEKKLARMDGYTGA